MREGLGFMPSLSLSYAKPAFRNIVRIMKIIVIGNGIAGYTFASLMIKGLDYCRLEVFSDESFSPYYRTRILSLLDRDVQPSTLEILPRIDDGRYSLKNLHVDTIDCENKLVYTSDGRMHQYDVLVLANGAKANMLPLPGGRSKGIFSIRTVDDVHALSSWLEGHGDHVVVLGGGLLGLEAACQVASWTRRDVTVVESAGHLLPRQLDEDSARYLQRRLSQMSVKVLCGVKTSNFLSRDEAVTGIKCDDGFLIPSDTVIESVGIRPNTFLAVDAGLKVERAVVVDDHLRTSVEDVYAIGDVAQFDGVVAGQVSAAMAMARTLASNLCGKDAAYTPAPAQSMLKVADLDVISLGDVYGGDECIVNEGDSFREAFHVTGGMLTGCTLIGSREHYAAVRGAIGKPFSEIREGLGL